jgi:hypothetical protein
MKLNIHQNTHIPIHQKHYIYQIMEDDVSKACNMHTTDEKCIHFYLENERNTPNGTLCCSWGTE